MQNIYLKPVGEFFQDEKWEEDYDSLEVAIPFFNNEEAYFSLVYYADDKNFLADAEKLLQQFFQLTVENRNKLSDVVWKNCKDFLALVDYDEADAPLHIIKNANEIWQFVSPTQLQIMRNEDNNQLYLLVYCHCEWEQEHGLQITIQEDMVITAVAEIDCSTRDDGLNIQLLNN